MDDFFKTTDVASFLATDEARLRLVLDDPRYLEPTLPRFHFLRFRLVFDCLEDTRGGSTQVFAVYEVHRESKEPVCMIRHVTIARGPFGSFDLQRGVTILDRELKKTVLKSLKREFVLQDLPAIHLGSEYCTNINYVEVEWMFNRTSRKAGWAVPNRRLSALYERLKIWSEALMVGEAP